MKIEYNETDYAGEYEVFAAGIKIGYLFDEYEIRFRRFVFEWRHDYNLGKLDDGQSSISANTKEGIEAKIKTTIENLISELKSLIE